MGLTDLQHKQALYRMMTADRRNQADDSNAAEKTATTQEETKVSSVLTLKVGARVRLLRNLAVDLGLANGTVGTVVGFINSKTS